MTLPLDQLLYGLTQGYVLGPLLFKLYTTPLSTLIAQSSAKHQLFADGTQPFLSFSAPNVSFSITHFEQTISQVSAWMSANFLSLNSSKTEFLLIDLHGQLKKINNICIIVLLFHLQIHRHLKSTPSQTVTHPRLILFHKF